MAQKILVVDDEANIRNLMDQILEVLEDEDVEILFAEDGQEAMDTIESEKPELVFLDVMMPEMDGFEVCERVKNTEALEDVHIVLLTAKGQEADKQKGMDAGANDYMTKPFRMRTVLNKAREVLGLEAD